MSYGNWEQKLNQKNKLKVGIMEIENWVMILHKPNIALESLIAVMEGEAYLNTSFTSFMFF